MSLEVADWLVIRRRFDSYTVSERNKKIVIQTATLELLPLGLGYDFSLTPLGGGPARIGARAERVRLITAGGTEARAAACCARGSAHPTPGVSA